jgi:hypothetical protein
MLRRAVRQVTVIAAAGLMAVGMAASTATAASAAPHKTTMATVKSGTTTVTTAPGIAKALLDNGVLPIVTSPGRAGVKFDHGLRLVAAFSVTGGKVSLKPLGGTVLHKGGIKFVNINTGKALEVGDFTIDLKKGQLTGAVNRTKTRVPVFKLDLSHATIEAKGKTVFVRNVGLDLTGAAAGALNQSLGTKLFAEGLRFGSANSTVNLK